MNEDLVECLTVQFSRDDEAGALPDLHRLSQSALRFLHEARREGQSAFEQEITPEDPFRAASGYHRIALDVMNALCDSEANRVIVNVRNGSMIPEIAADDVIETASGIKAGETEPLPVGPVA